MGEWLGGGQGMRRGENGRFHSHLITHNPQQAGNAGKDEDQEDEKGEGISAAGQG